MMINSKHTVRPVLGLLVFLISGLSLVAQQNSPLVQISSNNNSTSKNVTTNQTSNVQAIINIQSDVIGSRDIQSIDLPSIPIDTRGVHTILTNTAGPSNSSTNNTVNCPMMYVDVDLPSLESCQASSATVSYCNHGTADATGVYIDVTFDTVLTLDSASVAYTQVSPNTYRFQVGTVLTAVCNNVTVHFTTVCDSALFTQEHCINAQVYPDTLCNSVWSSHLLNVHGTCEGSNIKFTIINIGTPVVIGQNISYVVIEDNFLAQGGAAVIIHQGILEVDRNASVDIDVLNVSSTKRYKIELREANGDLIAWAAVENCSPAGNELATSYHVQDFWNGSILPSKDEGCAINGASSTQSNAAAPPPTNNGNTSGSGSSTNSNNQSSFNNFEDEPTLITVFPNPFDVYTTIKIEGPIPNEFSFKLYDITGKIVAAKFLNNVRTFSIARDNLLDGMYFYQVEGAGKLIGAGKILVR